MPRASSPLGALPNAAEVSGALSRLDAWIAARGLGTRFGEWLRRVANPARALANLESLIGAGEEPGAEELEPLLRVLGASQTLAATILSVPDSGLRWFRQALSLDRVAADEHVRQMLAAASSGADTAAVRSSEIPAILRRHKRRHFLRIGARDLLGLAGVEETTREISALADGAIEVASRHARARVAAEFGEFAADDRLRFTVLAMGKLGGSELNYSSDVDLVYLYQGGDRSSRGGPRGSLVAHSYAARISEHLTRTLGERTAEGVVFRVDLRLRPDGQNGPIVNSLAAALVYYEAWGQTWERAAMLKARPAGGDVELGGSFLEEMRPFVYRRYLDFGVFESLRDMKAMIAREVERR
ncbi:MAG: bifunctional [glutamate--ammonia ligase]-adenylyl-L-tyrosine phosphorylase/[glutamate--ammonia-ligase] adenylyltransferase, partial [Candidatus Binatia bacterium]